MQKVIGLAVAAFVLVSSASARAQAPSRIPQSQQQRARSPRQLSRTQIEAQQACQNAINTRAGYQARRVGTPVRHGTKQWDVPVTVRRDGSETLRVSCRYNGANGKVTLRPR